MSAAVIPSGGGGTRIVMRERRDPGLPAENGAPEETEAPKTAANTASASPAQEGLATVRGSTRESHVGPHGSRLA